jgi:hypothetical protein
MISGLKYQAQFNGISNGSYTLNIYKKNYNGSMQTILLGADPVIQEWSEDSYLGPIKGSTLKMNIINNGDVSLTDFYSDIDNEFYIEFLKSSQVLFRGYIVQDDCQEIQVDFSHIINLTATDNLGLLKELKFDEAARLYGLYEIQQNLTIKKPKDTTNIFTIDELELNFYNGQLIDIYNMTLGNATYTVDYTEYIDDVFYVHTLEEVIEIGSSETNATISFYNSFDLNGNVNYATIIRICLHATNMRLNNYVCTTLFPINGQAGRWLDDTCVNIKTFLSSKEWNNCYEVLEKIFNRFDATIFQSLGSWYIVRWNEIKINGNWDDGAQVPTYYYDANYFAYQSTTNNDIINEYNVNQIETGLLKSIVRPYKFVEETFNYEAMQNPNLNLDLQILGELIAEYSSGDDYIKEYEFANWEISTGGYNVTKRIVIVYDFNGGREIERYLKIQADDAVNYAIVSQGIVVDVNTQVDLSFEFRTTNHQTRATTIPYIFGIGPYDRSYLYKLNVNLDDPYRDGTWTTDGSYTVNFNDDSFDWHSVKTQFIVQGTTEAKLAQTDREGFFFMSLNNNVFEDSTEATLYRNLQLKLTPIVNNEELITGHKHTETITNSLVKNNYTEEVFVDDATQRAMKGCQFLYENTTSLLAKTTNWNIVSRSYEYDSSLGDYMTKERLVNQFNANTRYEGVLRGIAQNGPLSMFALLKLPFESIYYRYAFGQLSINYREESADFTAYRVFDANSYDDLLSEANYKFDYLYQNK